MIDLDEAQDINLYLKPLRGMLEEMEQVEFDEIIPSIPPMMRVLALIWANSQYYNTPGRIIVILQEICNMFITMVTLIVNNIEVQNVSPLGLSPTLPFLNDSVNFDSGKNPQTALGGALENSPLIH